MDAGANRSQEGVGADAPPRRQARRVLSAGVGIAALLVGFGWSERGDIANHEIGAMLRAAGIRATYRVRSIGLDRQIVTDVVIGDPAHPDLTIDRVVTGVGLNGAGLNGSAPGIDRVTLVNPRLRASWRNGKFSVGSLDRLLNGPSTAPFRLPDVVLRVIDGRADIDGDAGAIRIGLDGGGALRGGFAGALVAVARRLEVAGCGAVDVKLSGHLAVADERPRLTGPLRLAGLRCAAVRSGRATLPLDLRADAALDGGDGRVGWVVKDVALGAAHADGSRGRADLSWHGGAVTARFTGDLRRVDGPRFTVTSLGAEGLVRIAAGAAHLTAEGTLAAAGLAPDAAAWHTLDRARQSAANTPAGPLLTRIAQVLASETPGSSLSGRFMLHGSGAAGSLFIPEARLSGGSGGALVTVSRGAVVRGHQGTRLSGSFTTGGPLPPIAGTVVRGDDGRDRLNLAMAEYRAGTAAAALPHLTLAMAGGRLALAGDAVLSGPLPGGAVKNLHLPIAGWWNARGVSLWPGCTDISFDRLVLASLTLLSDRLTICPRPGGAIVQGGDGGLGIAAGVPAFDLAGQSGGAPIRLTGGPLGIVFLPGSAGTLVAKSVAVELGTGQGTSRFRLDDANAALGSTIGGRFSGGQVDLAAVPLKLRQVAGEWRYDAGTLTMADAAFRVEDRETPARFQPLVARGGTLKLASGTITAEALLREPRSDLAIARVAIRHDLNTGHGHADLAVDGIRFDKGLQPDAVSALALGVVADVTGTVAGTGTIDWANGNIRSRGRFATDALDLAAAFGPVKGLAGTVNFTDLLGLVSAPDQKLTIAAINPGVEVDDGVLTYALLPGHILAIYGASWPFLDGHLQLLPTRMTLGVSEIRRYEMQVDGIDAAKFLVRMNMSNLSATGLFDGGLPLVFDRNGGRIVGGLLASRLPGGSVSYIGTLSYKNLSPIANYAFQTLKSLDYKQLTIGLDGSLSGDIFTRVSMRGVTQGPGAKRNFLTRQIAGLPLQFNVNIHAPFYMLLTNFKSLYDSSYLPDPRTLGLLGADGKPAAHRPPAPVAGVQPAVSETKP